MESVDVPVLQRELASWADDVRRDLPWRRTRDAWEILVSELMLQQTQVARVVPRWQAFLEDFPTPQACANAPSGAVIAAWQGLGYNRRARNLHAAAVVIVERHGGEVPDSLDALLALPGIGPYTARAVLAFAFERDAAVIDTNVARFLSRAVAGRSLRPKEAQELADGLVPAGRGWAWNQGLLDFGAMVCTKRSPQCEACPVRARCVWAASGFDGADPAEGSAGTSGRQSRFEGSDRQGRGRLVDALRAGPVSTAELHVVMGWPQDPERARRVAATVVADGLAEHDDGRLALPA